MTIARQVLPLGFVAAALIAAAGGAYAHGDEHHQKADGKAQPQDHAAALGQPGQAAKVSRTIEITMDDTMRFSPASVTAKRGETIRFVVKNEGKLKHEMVLGTIAELKEHAALMQRFPQMEHVDPNQVSVDPGKTGELIWQFTKAGKFDFACLQAGHFEAGMRGNVVVVAQGGKQAAAAVPAADMADGEVRRVDKEGGKILLKHGYIKNLDMPGMTMVFKVKDAAMLDNLQPGDRVRFAVEPVGSGFVVTEISVAR